MHAYHIDLTFNSNNQPNHILTLSDIYIYIYIYLYICRPRLPSKLARTVSMTPGTTLITTITIIILILNHLGHLLNITPRITLVTLIIIPDDPEAVDLCRG